MKDKTKNILKGVGVGALACLGMFTFAGCSMELNQEQIDKLMYAVDHSEEFMNDILDLLENQNAKMEAERAYNLCKYGINKIILNQNGIRDNFTMQIVSEGDVKNKIVSYRNGNDDVIIFESVLSSNVFYTEEDKNYRADLVNGTRKEIESSIHSGFGWDRTVNFIGVLELTKDDISICNILPNGNYEIVFSQNIQKDKLNTESALILTVEITADGDIVKLVQSSAQHSEDLEGFLDFYPERVTTFAYGTVEEDYVNSKLTEAKAVDLVN